MRLFAAKPPSIDWAVTSPTAALALLPIIKQHAQPIITNCKREPDPQKAEQVVLGQCDRLVHYLAICPEIINRWAEVPANSIQEVILGLVWAEIIYSHGTSIKFGVKSNQNIDTIVNLGSNEFCKLIATAALSYLGKSLNIPSTFIQLAVENSGSWLETQAHGKVGNQLN